MSRKIEHPLVPYRATCCVSFDDTLVVFSIHRNRGFDTQVGEDGLHLLYILVSSIYHC